MIIGFRVQGSGLWVMGYGGGFAANIYGAMPEGSIQVTSHLSLLIPNHSSLATSHQSLVTSHSFSLPLEGKVPRRGG